MTYSRAVPLPATDRVDAANTLYDIKAACFLLEAALDVDNVCRGDYRTKNEKILYFLSLFNDQLMPLLESLEKTINW
jgi:hypothetical protein